jgi:hypothetical protein
VPTESEELLEEAQSGNESGKASWHTPTASQNNLVAQVVVMRTIASTQSHTHMRTTASGSYIVMAKEFHKTPKRRHNGF